MKTIENKWMDEIVSPKTGKVKMKKKLPYKLQCRVGMLWTELPAQPHLSHQPGILRFQISTRTSKS